MPVDASKIIGDSDDFSDILNRFVDNVPAYIYCGVGWSGILRECADELFRHDPNYAVVQIKEKFGGLRFYFNPSDMDNYSRLSGIVSRIEEKSFHICEECGEDGYRRNLNGRYYVACDRHE